MLVYPSAKRIDCSGLFAALVSSALLFHPSVHPARADEICMVGAAAQDKISDAALLLDPEIHQFRWVSDDGANGHIDTGEMPYREVAPNSGNPQRVLFTFVANGAPASCAATTGAQAHANVWLGAPGHQMLFAVDEFTLDIRADTNRDGAIDDKDEAGKRVFTTGAGGKGAIVWVNCDDNKGSSGDPDNRVPDNW
ncbi:MAG TPA: hypothetical protein VGS41_09090, partial [Chthonomonadales bacterium]|nr:hypothetical protein [Chthonomonadales bacterium]